MDYSLKTLNLVIERWIKLQYHHSPNEKSLTTYLKKLYSELKECYSDENNGKLLSFANEVYRGYCYGKWEEVQLAFLNDYKICLLLEEKLRTELIKKKLIKKIKNGTFSQTIPFPIYTYKILDEEIRKEIFKFCKYFIVTMEVEQKLDTKEGPHELLNELLKEIKIYKTVILQNMRGADETTYDGVIPVFKPGEIQNIFDLLKDFFSVEQQPQLKELLETGNNLSSKLIFLDNGNRLADAFKQLIDGDLITGCNKKDLEKWIFINFNYVNKKKIKMFTIKYLNDIISTTKKLCHNPILDVKKGIIEKA